VVGAAHVARASGYDDVLTFDMGGTSTDVAPVPGGETATTTEATVAGVPIRHPAVDVHTVSAGGGSIASGDAGGALRVGPESAGAEPGPAAYGRGGERPTVTDANLLVGHLADGVELGGEVTLRRDLAERALAALGDGLGLDAHETALGVIGVANAEMVRALRVISVERGLDPREFALVAFGGAGGMHACALAEELGMATVLVPRAGGVLSALGLALSDVRRDYVHPFLVAWDDLDPDQLDTAFRELEGRAAADLELAEQAFSAVRRADVRYRGQSYELGVEADDVPAIAARFHAAHARRFGYEMEDEPLELVNLRLGASVEVERPELREDPPADDPAEPGRRRVSVDGDWRDVLVLDRSALGAGSVVEGPAIVESGESTCVVRPGWRGAVDGAGTLVLARA
jgi:N-methylhydantoinase A